MVESLTALLQAVVQEDQRLRRAAVKSQGSAETLRLAIRRAEQNIQRNQTARMAAYERYSDGQISREEFIRQKAQLVAETDRLTKEKADMETRLADLEKAQSSQIHETAQTATWFLGENNVTNEMLRMFIDRVLVYTGGRVEIVYRFGDPFAESEPAADNESMENA